MYVGPCRAGGARPAPATGRRSVAADGASFVRARTAWHRATRRPRPWPTLESLLDTRGMASYLSILSSVLSIDAKRHPDPPHGRRPLPAAAGRGDGRLSPDHQLDREGALHAIVAAGHRAGALLRQVRRGRVPCRSVAKRGSMRRNWTRSRWWMPAVSLVLGAIVLAAMWIGGNRDAGLESFALFVALAALFFFGGRSDTLRGL